MTERETQQAILLLAKAIERVTVNTYVEQGSVGADAVFEILGRVEDICKTEEQE